MAWNVVFDHAADDIERALRARVLGIQAAKSMRQLREADSRVKNASIAEQIIYGIGRPVLQQIDVDRRIEQDRTAGLRRVRGPAQCALRTLAQFRDRFLRLQLALGLGEIKAQGAGPGRSTLCASGTFRRSHPRARSWRARSPAARYRT